MRVYRIPFSTNVERVALAARNTPDRRARPGRAPSRQVAARRRFNRVWKVPPNRLTDHGPDADLERELRDSRDLFEAILDGRDYLLGEFSAADCAAFPFLEYGLIYDPADDEPFHRVLIEHLALDGRYPRLEAWIRRVDDHPRT